MKKFFIYAFIFILIAYSVSGVSVIIPNEGDKIIIEKTVKSGDITVIIHSITQADRIYRSICFMDQCKGRFYSCGAEGKLNCDYSNCKIIEPGTIFLAGGIKSCGDPSGKDYWCCPTYENAIIDSLEDDVFFVLNLTFIQSDDSPSRTFSIEIPSIPYTKEKIINDRTVNVTAGYYQFREAPIESNACFLRKINENSWRKQVEGQLVFYANKKLFPQSINFKSVSNELRVLNNP